MIAAAMAAPANRLIAAEATSISSAKAANGARIRKIVMAASKELIFTS
jgi:hypothetical protein